MPQTTIRKRQRLQRQNVKRFPTASGANRESPNALARAVIARQPVQWPAAITDRLNFPHGFDGLRNDALVGARKMQAPEDGVEGRAGEGSSGAGEDVDDTCM